MTLIRRNKILPLLQRIPRVMSLDCDTSTELKDVKEHLLIALAPVAVVFLHLYSL